MGFILMYPLLPPFLVAQPHVPTSPPLQQQTHPGSPVHPNPHCGSPAGGRAAPAMLPPHRPHPCLFQAPSASSGNYRHAIHKNGKVAKVTNGKAQFWCSSGPRRALPTRGRALAGCRGQPESPGPVSSPSRSLLAHAVLGGFGGDQGGGAQLGGRQREAVAVLLVAGPGGGQQHHVALAIALAARPPLGAVPPGWPRCLQAAVEVRAGAPSRVGLPQRSSGVRVSGAGQGAGFTQAF